MRKKSTRLLSAALAVCMTVTVLPMSAFASGVAEFESGGSPQETAAAQSVEPGDVTGDVKIDAAHFPDEVFRAYIKLFDYDSNKGTLSKQERAAVKDLNLENLSSSTGIPGDGMIRSLKGIEYFTSLKKLSCRYNLLTELDVSKNRELELLNCSHNQLSELKVSDNPALKELNCEWNQLIALDVSSCSALEKLKCNENQLSALKFSSKNSALKSLVCDYNQLSELDVSNCQALSLLECSHNQLGTLDVKKNLELESLSCEVNQLSTLDVSKNSALSGLVCNNNKLSALDVRYNPALKALYCNRNQLSALDLSKNRALEWLECSWNQLTSLDIGDRDFKYFSCQGNSYDIVVDETNRYDLSKLPGNFDASKVENPQCGSFDPKSNILTVDEGETEITYTYNCGTNASGEKIMGEFKLIVTHEQQEPAVPDAPAGGSDTGNIQGALSAVVVGAAAGAIIYEAGTGIYRVINMPGIPMPSNRIELAELLWEHAGKPEPVSTALYSDIDEDDPDAQKAARWAVEQVLMKDDADNNKFNPYFPVSKLRTCLTWNAAKEKGLFDKTEE